MIKYSLVMRGKPGKPEEPKQVFASAQSIKKMSLEEVAKYIKQHGCAYNVGDFLAMTDMLAQATADLLKEGYRIDLGELGEYYVTLGCEGAESRDDFNPDKHIKELRVHWTPGETFKDLRQGATFEENLDRRTELKLLRAERKGEAALELE